MGLLLFPVLAFSQSDNLSTETLQRQHGDTLQQVFMGMGNQPPTPAQIAEWKSKGWVLIKEEAIATNFPEVRRKIAYPETARDAGIQGKVVMRILVGADGKVIDYYALKSPDPSLQREVERYIGELLFTPATGEDGQPITAWATLPIQFKLF